MYLTSYHGGMVNGGGGHNNETHKLFREKNFFNALVCENVNGCGKNSDIKMRWSPFLSSWQQ